MKKVFYYETPIGQIGLAEEYGFITNLYFMNMKQPVYAKRIKTETSDEAYGQLMEYLRGDRQEFDLPLNPSGTDSQQTIWSELLNIPYGEVKSYKEIATALGNEKLARAVGNASNKNPIPIIIPCHRVIASNGDISGYVGGAEIKQKLLEIEGREQ